MVLSRGLAWPLWAVHKQIAAAIDLIVQHEFARDGSRKITRITEVCGYQDGNVVLHDIFEYRRTGQDEDGRELGEWVCHGVQSPLVTRCDRLGVKIPMGVLRVDATET